MYNITCDDKHAELAVGNLHGDLAVFKIPQEELIVVEAHTSDNAPTRINHGEADDLRSLRDYTGRPRPWRMYRDLGTITALAVGDVRNQQRPSLVVVTAEGYCYVFDFGTSTAISENVKHASHEQYHHAPSLRLPVPVNISRLLLADVDGDDSE